MYIYKSLTGVDLQMSGTTFLREWVVKMNMT